MTSLTVACVWVKGNVDYSKSYVRHLRSLVELYIDRPFRFVCLTDQDLYLEGVETIRVPAPVGFPGWWSKLELFNPAHKFRGRVLYLDLDTLPVASLVPIIEYPAPFAIVPTAGTFQGRGNLRVVKKYNSSVMVWTPSPRYDRLYRDWSSRDTRRLWGDQDWIAEMLPDEAMMPLSWFPRLSEIRDGQWSSEAKVILCKRPKNEEAARTMPWFAERWKA